MHKTPWGQSARDLIRNDNIDKLKKNTQKVGESTEEIPHAILDEGIGEVKELKTDAVIKIREMEDGRFSAQYLNEADRPLHGIEQYGKTATEAKINLRVLIKAICEAQLKTNVTFYP